MAVSASHDGVMDTVPCFCNMDVVIKRVGAFHNYVLLSRVKKAICMPQRMDISSIPEKRILNEPVPGTEVCLSLDAQYRDLFDEFPHVSPMTKIGVPVSKGTPSPGG